MEKYRFIDDLTSDVMFEARGRDLEELLVNAAEALFSVICDIKAISPRETFTLKVKAADEGELLHEWLSRLLTESEINGLFLSRFSITDLSAEGTDLHLEAAVSGEPVSPEKGDTVVKGITYYGFKLEKYDSGYLARVAMDI